MSNSPFPTDKGLQKPVCVFCGSSPGTDPIYTHAAQSLGQALSASKIPLVYGGGRRGIMGVVSRAALESGGYVHGILPRSLMQRASEHTSAPGSNNNNGEVKSGEGTGRDLLEDNYGGKLSTEVVGSMHERKLKMAQLSTGGFVVLPGGYGTFEEMFEMITWNQLGIHSLPVVVLNIGGFYTSLIALLDKAVEAGFIVAKNLSLLKVIDADPSDPDSWGKAALDALNQWRQDEGAGYNFDWNTTANVTTVQTKDGFGHFTTLRYTSPTFIDGVVAKGGPTLPIERTSIPLLDRHIERLRKTHKALNERDGGTWGAWVGDDVVWDTLRSRLEEVERGSQGDWRVRVILSPVSKLSIDVQPFHSAPPFQYLPSAKFTSTTTTPSSNPGSALDSTNSPIPLKRRPIIIDPKAIPPSTESKMLRDTRLYKTLNRKVYTNATSRGEALSGITGIEVVVHTGEWILEGTTSNIAIEESDSDNENRREGSAEGKGQGEGMRVRARWITPRLIRDERPFLDGVMRNELLEKGVIKEGDLTIQDLIRARDQGRRIIGFNGLRGVWEAELI
ncbi:hypothetical protein BCR39DRAFT_499646 [Naematelia encephala]|uniref:Lysine decarboxylase-domain-containing protein n=1 Tax=Naematelia encephala TaxID=71784 RepID=A0A1Y2AR76_9TREE|nr:hypothetical protein BCR39DRAFT_499646 [Naematelia encephala]